MKSITKIALLLSAFCAANAFAAEEIRTLENMERERAQLITAVLDKDLSSAERQRKISFSSRRLVDMERMVIRDDRLTGSRSPLVRKAFGSYDLTFLVHASAEHSLGSIDHWFEQVGLSSDALLTSRKSVR